MIAGCLLSFVLYVTVAVVILKPELLPLLAGLIVVLVGARAVLSNPDWPVY